MCAWCSIRFLRQLHWLVIWKDLEHLKMSMQVMISIAKRYKTWQGSTRACAAPGLMETASTAPLVMHTWNNFLITKRNTTGI